VCACLRACARVCACVCVRVHVFMCEVCVREGEGGPTYVLGHFLSHPLVYMMQVCVCVCVCEEREMRRQDSL